MDLALQDRVAIVTGASQGIGRAIALTLAAEGAAVVLVARRLPGLEAVAAEVAALGQRTKVVQADVADPDGAAVVVEAALEAFGRIDILVNNAGKGAPKPMLELTDADWHASIELNLMSAVRLSLACVPLMKEQGWGRIVNISSRVAREPDPYFAPYAAAKAALINFSKNLANGFSKHGGLTNCVVQDKVFALVATNTRALGGAAQYLNDKGVPVVGIPITNSFYRYRHFWSGYPTGYPRDGTTVGYKGQIMSLSGSYRWFKSHLEVPVTKAAVFTYDIDESKQFGASAPTKPRFARPSVGQPLR